MPNKNEKFILPVILLTACLIRLVFNMALVGLDSPPHLLSDERTYDNITHYLLTEHKFAWRDGPPTSVVPPVYPFFLAFIYTIFGKSYLAVRLIQIMFSGLTCLVGYLLAKKVFNQTVGLITAGLMVFSPPLIYFSGILMSETLFIFFLAVSILYFYKTAENPSFKNQVILGILLGLATLTRSILLFFIPFIFIWAFVSGAFSATSPWMKRFRPPLVISAVMILILIPWAIRNYYVHHALVPVTVNSGCVLLEGNHPGAGAEHTPIKDWSTLGVPPPEFKGFGWAHLSEIESDNKFKELAVKWIKENPGEFCRLSIRRFFVLWNPWPQTTSEIGKKYAGWYGVYAVMILLLCFGGVIINYASWRKLSVIYLLFLYFSVTHMITLAITRYRLPLEPYLLILAAVSIYGILRLVKTKYQL